LPLEYTGILNYAAELRGIPGSIPGGIKSSRSGNYYFNE